MPESNPQNPPPFTSDGTPTMQQLVDYFVEALYDPTKLKRLENTNAAATAKGAAAELAGILEAGGELAAKGLGTTLGFIAGIGLKALRAGEPVFDEIGKVSLDVVFGDGGGRGKHKAQTDNIGKHLIASMTGGGGALEPGTDRAADYISNVLNQQIEGWLFGAGLETLTEHIKWLNGGVEAFEKLQDIVLNFYGGSRVMRRVLGPFLDVGLVTPARWSMNKQYRPELLSPADTIRQWHRGRWSDAQRDEELARQGFSADRINALVNAQRKFFSPANVRTFVERQHWTSEQGVQHLRDQGYDQTAAVDALRIEGLSIFESHEATEASAIISAYASHDIEHGDFLALLQTYVGNDRQRALYEELGELRRRLFIRHLSSSQAEQAVKVGILNFRDYRDALAREGYDDQAVTVLELQLRFEMDKAKTIEQHRRELEAQRAAEKQLRDAAAAERRAQVDADRALKRRGSLGDLERAAVRGLIPFARVEEVLGAEYDSDTVEILVGLMEQDRQTYLAQQAAAEDARKRAARRDIDVGTLEQAVFDNLLTIVAFRQRLSMLKFDPSDADLLTGIVAMRKADLDNAKRKRDDAEKAARIKSIDLGRFERLVRLGARSLADYDRLLAGLGFDDPSRAAMRELLELEIAKDQQAAAARQAAEEKLRAKGLSNEQFRRAVVLGLKSVDDYNRFLVNQGFTGDAIATLVAEVVLAVADAEAARRKRAAAGATGGEPELSLSTVARAARLGILSPEDYQVRLLEAGYSADDVAIELELLAVEIADVQAARARRDELEAETGERGLSLREVEQAVKAGLASVDDYRARAFSLNYSADDVELLVALLEDELAAKAGTPGDGG